MTLSLLILVPACGGRIPSDTKTAKLSKSYFHKYGKKYKETQFADKSVQEAEVKAVKELQKNVATGLVVLKLKSGTEIPVIMTMLRRAPLGWKVTGWEIFRN